MISLLLFVLLGLTAGFTSGVMGMGGNIIVVPSLIYFFGFTQHKAQGTSMALLTFPIGLLAAWNYHRHGLMDLRAAASICLGFLVGGALGSNLAISLSESTLRKGMGVVLLLAGLRMIVLK